MTTADTYWAVQVVSPGKMELMPKPLSYPSPCEVRIDFIFFTGSTNVDKVVARAAAENLLPVFLSCPSSPTPISTRPSSASRPCRAPLPRSISGTSIETWFSSPEGAAHPSRGAVEEIRKRPRNGETVQLSAADPLNLVGIVLPGPRIPAVATNSVTYVDGAVATAPRPVLTA